MAFGAPAFWWRRCWSVAPRATWPKPKRRSTGWRTCRPIEDSAMREITLLRLRALLARARGDDVAYRGLGEVAIARWRNRLASKDTSTGPRRWSRYGDDGGRGVRVMRHRAARERQVL